MNYGIIISSVLNINYSTYSVTFDMVYFEIYRQLMVDELVSLLIRNIIKVNWLIVYNINAIASHEGQNKI